MIFVAIKGILSRKLRLLLTTCAVVMGVAFISGTLVFGASIDSAFDDLFQDANAATDVVVRSSAAAPDAQSDVIGDADEDPSIDQNTRRVAVATIEQVEAVDGVRYAEGGIEGTAQILGTDGTPIGRQGPPTLGLSDYAHADLSPLTVIDGRRPARAGEVMIDGTSANAGNLRVGDDVTILLPGSAPQRFSIVGIAGVGTSGGSQATMAVFDRATAARLLHSEGHVDEIRVRAEAGISPAELRQRIDRALGDEVDVVTGAASAKEEAAAIGDALRFITYGVLAFGGIALLVGAFVIFNTFSMIVAQRSREVGLLRAIGATRRQATAMVLAEGAIVGVLASAVGTLSGLLVARALRWVMGLSGGSLPQGELTLSTQTILISGLTGVLVTLLATAIPAIRAARVSPLEAMRSATEEPPRVSRRLLLAGLVLVCGGLGGVAVGGFVGDVSLLERGAWIGTGFLALIAGTSMLAPAAVRPIVGTLAAPLIALGGMPGHLARENAVRSPRRTASTAAALMIGIGVACLAAVVASSYGASVEAQVERSIGADVILSSSAQATRLHPDVARRVGAVDEVADAVPVRTASWLLGNERLQLAAADPSRVAGVLHLDLVEGAVADLGRGQVLVAAEEAAARGWTVGDEVEMVFGDTERRSLEVAGTYAASTIGDYLVDIDLFEQVYPATAQQDTQVLVRLAEGTTAAAGAKAVTRALRDQPFVQVQDQAQLKESQRALADQLLLLVYGMLGLSVLIALFGIVNTLALSIFERTRELGLLRAVGMTRGQARGMIAAESVMISVLGAVLGVTLGVLLGWAGVQALAGVGLTEFAVPWASIAVLLAAGIGAGLLAAAAPARRAARLDVLSALAHD